MSDKFMDLAKDKIQDFNAFDPIKKGLVVNGTLIGAAIVMKFWENHKNLLYLYNKDPTKYRHTLFKVLLIYFQQFNILLCFTFIIPTIQNYRKKQSRNTLESIDINIIENKVKKLSVFAQYLKDKKKKSTENKNESENETVNESENETELENKNYVEYFYDNEPDLD